MRKANCLLLLASMILSILLFAGPPAITANSGTSDGLRQYWISYYKNDRVFLMKIDLAGNVIVRPRAVMRGSDIGQSRVDWAIETAISHHGKWKLNLWAALKRSPDWNRIEGHLYRALIDKRDLRMDKLFDTGLTFYPSEPRIEFGSYIQSDLDATKRKGYNFLALVDGFKLIGHGLTQEGRLTGKSWVISAPVYAGAISPNGRVAIAIKLGAKGYSRGLWLQRLKPGKGTPSGQPSQIGSPNIAMITNLLPGNKRFVLYVKSFPSPTRATLCLLPVDGRTGAKIGERIALYRKNNFISGMAIAPFGEFVLWDDFHYLYSYILFQRLDTNGHPIGAPRPIVQSRDPGYSLQNIDILADEVPQE